MIMTGNEIKLEMREIHGSERSLLSRFLSLITLAECQRVFVEDGYGSVKRWLVCEFGYSESPANQRLQASRFSRAFPIILDLISKGELTLTTVCLLRGILSQEERRIGCEVPREMKLHLIEKIRGCTEEKTQSILADAFPDIVKRADSLKPIGHDEVLLQTVLTSEDAASLTRVRLLRSHAMPYATWGQLIGFLSYTYIKREEQLGLTTRDAAGIGGAKRRFVLRRAGDKCEFVSPDGVCCGSQYQLEVDHILPKARGGTNALDNLRCLCRVHNQYMAWKILGDTALNWRK
jgi:hypothetical protein